MTNQTNPIRKDVLTRRMKDFLKVFDANAGLVYISCTKAGIHHSTYYDWLDKSPKFVEACNAVKEGFKDYVEGRIRSHIKSINRKISADMCKFYAKTKMRDRGYIERTEHELSGELNGATKLILEIIDGNPDENGTSDESSEEKQ